MQFQETPQLEGFQFPNNEDVWVIINYLAS